MQIGNAWIDDNTGTQGIYDYYWTHALNSDETNKGIERHCDYITGNYSKQCYEYQSQGDNEVGALDIYNIYAPICHHTALKPGPPGSVSLLFQYIHTNMHLTLKRTSLLAE